MINLNIKILLVEDDLIDQMAFKRMVSSHKLPYSYTICGSYSEAFEVLNSESFDIILTDFNLGDGTAFDILKISKDIPLVITTGAGDQEIAVKAMKEGACDYLIKDHERNYLKTLPLTVESAIKHRIAEKQFKMLSHTLMSINDSVWISTLEGSITFVNKAFLKKYDYEEQEIIGKPVSIIYSSKVSQDIIENNHSKTLSGGWKGEIVSARKDGSEFPIILSTSIVYDEKNKPMALSAVAKDITEQKKAHLELKQAKELAEAASKSKSEFLANMSHEIRTPMNGIFGMIQLALDTNLTDEQREYLRTVNSSADSLLTIINDILDFSKIEAGKLELSLTEFDIEDVILDIIKAFSLRMDQKNIALNYKLDPAIPKTLIGDPVRLNQIIVNLIGNSIKFTNEGEINLDISLISIKEKKAALHFNVTDTGIGISEEQKKNIFNSFVQADGSTSRKYGGTGLGLAISSQLVSMMSGKIWVESPVVEKAEEANKKTKQGPGSSFQFDIDFEVVKNINLDLSPNEKVDENINKEDPLNDFQLNVLVAEDNYVNQQVAKRLLEKMNHKVDIAINGQEVLQKLDQASKYDLIFMDLQMPEMDGFEATKIIRERESLTNNHTPIIALTANAMKGDRELCLEAGMDEYVSKPIIKSELIDAIRQVMLTENEI